MSYHFKYPEIYAELARQGISKTSMANMLGITLNGLRYKQIYGDFSGEEMKQISKLLNKPVSKLFSFSDEREAGGNGR